MFLFFPCLVEIVLDDFDEIEVLEEESDNEDEESGCWKATCFLFFLLTIFCYH
jgi:hypothetical protein